MPTTYAIPNGRTVMKVTTYTGTGSNVAISNVDNGTLGFKPDLVWIKCSSNAYDNDLFDSVRGPLKILVSNNQNTQDTQAAGKTLTAFNTNGFQLGTDNSSSGSVNNTGWSYVGWQWQAGQGSTSTNNNGTIASTVSVNATAGFSVVQYVVPASGTFTWGHGLSAAPQFIILKGGYLTNTYNWDVYHVSIGPTVRLVLNSSSGPQTYSGPWNNTTPTSTTVSQQNGWYATNDTNIAYCWTPIAGYSQFGSYTGNGSTDGPFVYTGFQPAFIMIKCTSTTGNWLIHDNQRPTYNPENKELYPNLNYSEGTSPALDFVSNGFKIRDTYADINSNGATYAYAVFASNPFKYANAR